MKDISYTKYSTLENCEHEPLSFLGSIQTFGVLIVYDVQKELVTFCSENITHEFDVSLKKILGSSFEQLKDFLGFDLEYSQLVENSNINDVSRFTLKLGSKDTL